MQVKEGLEGLGRGGRVAEEFGEEDQGWGAGRLRGMRDHCDAGYVVRGIRGERFDGGSDLLRAGERVDEYTGPYPVVGMA